MDNANSKQETKVIKADSRAVKKGRLVRGSTKVFADLGKKLQDPQALELGIGK